MTRTGKHVNSATRWAGMAGLAWVAFQLLMLARADGPDAWNPRALAINVLPVLVLAILVVRGSLVAAVILGVYGAARLIMGTLVLIRLSRGTASQTHDGLALEVGLVMVFALVWVLGGVSAAGRIRSRRSG